MPSGGAVDGLFAGPALCRIRSCCKNNLQSLLATPNGRCGAGGHPDCVIKRPTDVYCQKTVSVDGVSAGAGSRPAKDFYGDVPTQR